MLGRLLPFLSIYSLLATTVQRWWHLQRHPRVEAVAGDTLALRAWGARFALFWFVTLLAARTWASQGAAAG